MNLRLWSIPFFIVLVSSFFGCSTKTTFTPVQVSVPYTVHALQTLPPEARAKIREMNHAETHHSILFYTNNTNYVLITSGRKPTGGYSIKINKISLDQDKMATIYVADIPPATGAMVPQIITSPVLAISIPENIKETHLVWE